MTSVDVSGARPASWRERGLLWSLSVVLLIRVGVSMDGSPGPQDLALLLLAASGFTLPWLPFRTRRLVQWLAAVALLLAAGVEGTLQLLRNDSYRTLCRLDPVCLFRLQPGCSKQHLSRESGEQVSVVINSHGFRGAELLPDGLARRVMVYGDSFVEAEAVPEPQTFVATLGGLLARASGDRVECVNAGVIGYGPDQALLRMRDELPHLRPELVLLSIFAGNDFGDMVRNKLFAVDARGGLRLRPFVIGDDAAASLRGRTGLLLPGWLRAGLSDLPVLAAHLGLSRWNPEQASWRRRFLPLLEQQFRDHRALFEQGDLVVHNLIFDYYDLDLSLAPSGPSARDKRSLMAAVLREVAGCCAESDARLIVMVVPAPIDLSEGRGFRTLAQRDYPAYRPQALTDAAVEAARTAGVPVVDLFPDFEDAGGDGLYFQQDDHWNADGQQLASSKLAERILDLGLF